MQTWEKTYRGETEGEGESEIVKSIRFNHYGLNPSMQEKKITKDGNHDSCSHSMFPKVGSFSLQGGELLVLDKYKSMCVTTA